jgi:hypothetical protein
MDIDTVYEFSAGKNDWNTIEVGLHDGRIVVRDEIGMLEFDDEDVDQLHNAIDQARRRLREQERRPTQTGESAADETTDGQPDAEAADTDHDASDDTDEPESTGLGPQFPGTGPR